ncbi:DNA/RNA helicase domain-containing protein [Comamonas sp. JC664]|uniref:DNA/RNA helicase domain-containing protein n=1 Tax=Comamonas sp. JC664 TaxID=2801917 RepID=UPI003617145B
MLASSNAIRLKPHGVFVKSKIEPAKWFLAPKNDVRSSDALEDAATEFDIQGLELDWTCLCWDANYRREGKTMASLPF